MYIPRPFQLTDPNEAMAFIQAYSFGLLTTNGHKFPMATHLPFTVERDGESIILHSHLAALNPQAKKLDESQVLVVFSEPHAYISPTHYNRAQNVPTWNYVAVHCNGTASLAKGDAARIHILEKMIDTYEPRYQEQWKSLPDDYRRGLLSELEAFTISVEHLEACYKLSQDKKHEERERIISHLSQKGDGPAQDLAGYMLRGQANKKD